MKKILSIVMSLGLVLGLSMTAFAAVLVDSTGNGFIGKGDVQLAFGWNNKQLQDNAKAVTFTYNAIDVYETVSYMYTGVEGEKNYKKHTITVPRRASISSNVAYEARTQKQINGFNLTGFGSIVTEGRVPVVGEKFNEGNDDWIYESVVLVSTTGGLLYVNFGEISVPLSNTPVPEL